ncbi:MAG: 1-deoxy-D-xylulose-5-phosphate reductoisomerase [Clostridia bacterium]|nr:1-deoxy-D-xylulose-5-phosphate reductoisomerase [Clostridia bacterium]
MNQTITILGSTGSIGRQTLDVMENLGLSPLALAAGSNDKLMEEQIRKFRPKYAALADEKAALRLKAALADTDTLITGGAQAVEELAALPGDTTVCAMSGVAGLKPTLTAIETGHTIALANKETLVCGGDIVLSAAKKHGVDLLPVDSEHSAIFQSLLAGDRRDLKKIILTCSGGPFFGKDKAFLEQVTPADALRHPNWRMGPKITIDCATLMNKGLELIEAMHLFDVKASDIDIVIHRESIFHSFVEFADGAVIGEAAAPDMRLPIQYTLTYPRRVATNIAPLKLWEVGKLTFFPPDEEAFPALRLAKEAARAGGGVPVLLNGANEEAVALFLDGKIGFTDIPRGVAHVLETLDAKTPACFEDVAELDRQARVALRNFFSL